MLNTLGHLSDASVTATDGDIGHIKDAFFDDHTWTIRYLVVEAGTFLHGRKALISPYSVKHPITSLDNIHVALTCQQVKNSPDIDTHQPISRQHELQHLNYYGYPQYWGGDGLWAMAASPLLAIDGPSLERVAEVKAMRKQVIASGDKNLRSGENVKSYEIHASDGSIGHVKDFIFDTESWAIRYLVVDTSNWWLGGSKVLIGVHWIEYISWNEMAVHLKLTREQIKASPPYDESALVERDYEERLHDTYGRSGYWL